VQGSSPLDLARLCAGETHKNARYKDIQTVLENLAPNPALLKRAAKRGDFDTLKTIHRIYPSQMLKPVTENGETILHLAADAGHIDIVTWLSNTSPELLKIKNKRGKTALQSVTSLYKADDSSANLKEIRDYLKQKSSIFNRLFHR
jgi:ankyrin repeat protein